MHAATICGIEKQPNRAQYKWGQAGAIPLSGDGGPASSMAPCRIPVLALVMARNPYSVSISSRTWITAPGLEISRDPLKNASGFLLVAAFISIPFADEVADRFGVGAYDFRNVVAFEKRMVARVQVDHAYGMLA